MLHRRSLLAAVAGAAAGYALPRERGPIRIPDDDDIVVMLRGDERGRFTLPCGTDRCTVVDVSDEWPSRVSMAAICVITGHSAPPEHVLGRQPDDLMPLVAQTCQHGVVVDTCFGMSDTILRPLVAAGFRGLVVGPIRKLPARGLVYGPAFFDHKAPIAERLGAVLDPAGIPLIRWQANARDLDNALRHVEGLRPDELVRGLVRRHPHLYLSRLGDSATMLTHVPVERFADAEDELSPRRSTA